MKQKKTKVADVRYYWVLDCCDQKQYFILWRKGSTNLSDYFSKHPPPHPPTGADLCIYMFYSFNPTRSLGS